MGDSVASYMFEDRSSRVANTQFLVTFTIVPVIYHSLCPFYNLFFLRRTYSGFVRYKCFQRNLLQQIVLLRSRSDSLCRRTEELVRVHLFAGHDRKMQFVGHSIIADATSPVKYPLRLPCRLHGTILQSCDRVNLVVPCFVQYFDNRKPIFFLHPTP